MSQAAMKFLYPGLQVGYFNGAQGYEPRAPLMLSIYHMTLFSAVEVGELAVEVEQLEPFGRLSRCAGVGNPIELPAKETIEHMHAVSVAAFRVGPEVRMNGQRIGEYFEPNIVVVQSEYGSHVVHVGNMGITLLHGLRGPMAQKYLRQFLSTYPKAIGSYIG